MEFGGFQVDVPVSMNDKWAKAYLRAGLQMLNGENMLAFTRTRKTIEGGDFDAEIQFWVGGRDLERGVEEGAFEFYTKKERLLLDREREKLERYLSGIKDMTRLPGLVFVVDANKEEIAVREANRLGIPVVAIADTNADPDMLTIAIAGNDDAIRSVSLITGVMADEILMARREAPDAAGDRDEGTALTYSSDAGGTEPVDGKRKKRPKRRPRPELIKRRRHASDPEAGVPEGDDADGESESIGDEILDVELSLAEAVEAPPDDPAEVEVEEVAVTAEAVPGEDGDGKDPGSP